MLFKDIIGQQNAKRRLIQTVSDGRISHAQLFLAPVGSGGLALAIAYAQYISCTNRSENDSCNECLSCVKYNKLVHPDLHFAYPVAISKDVKVSTHVLPQWREFVLGNPYFTLFEWFEQLEAENKQSIIGADESAEIVRKLNLTTYEAEYKIMIIWMAEKMNQASANKLLKILEEPPEKTLFILVCESEEQMLATILSRTQLVRISRITDNDLCEGLISKYGISQQEASRIAFLVEGRVNEAIHIIKQENTEVENFELFKDWMRICLKFDTQKVTRWIESVATIGREQQKNFLAYSIQMLRSCLMKNYGAADLTRVEGETGDFIEKFSPFIHGSNCEAFVNELNKASFHIERNANPKILFMDLSLKANELLNMKELATHGA